MFTAIDHPDDPRIAPFTQLKERDLAREHNLFIAEGEHVVRRLLDSDFAVHSLLLAERRAAEIAPLAPAGTAVFVASQEVMNRIIGYKFHSGVIAAGVRPVLPKLRDLLPDGEAVKLVVCPDLNNAENLGSLIRLSAGFGATALLIGPRSTDPFLRQTVRVSMGTVFRLPIVQSTDVLADLQWLRQRQVRCIASMLSASATPLPRSPRSDRTAVLFGSEAHGLDADIAAACDERVTIPMHLNTDSLNVAVAAGIFLYHYWG